MPALPADIARYTTDGAVITAKNDALKAQDPSALDTGDRERELFFDNPADAQLVVDELFAFQSAPNRPHEAVETDDALGIGSLIPVFPKAPNVRLIDDTRGISCRAVLRAYSFEMSTDAYALELVGLPALPLPAGTPIFDSTNITFDRTTVKWDKGAVG